MKYVLLILLLLPLLYLCQPVQEPVFTLKPALGLNACQIHGDPYDGYRKVGFFGGIAVNARLSTKLSLEIGFYFSQKGALHNPNPDKGDYAQFRLNLNYFDIPLLLRYSINSRFFLTVGPSIAYLISHTESVNYVNRSSDYIYNNLEVGVNFGLGAKLSKNISFEVRSSNSVTPIRTIPNNQVYYNNFVARFFNKGYYNNILTFFLSYKIDFKRKHADKSS